MSLDKPSKAEQTYSYRTYLLAVVFSNFFVRLYALSNLKLKVLYGLKLLMLQAVNTANVQVSMPGSASVPADQIVESPALECVTLLEPK